MYIRPYIQTCKHIKTYYNVHVHVHCILHQLPWQSGLAFYNDKTGPHYYG